MASQHSSPSDEGTPILPDGLRERVRHWIDCNYDELGAKSYPGNRKPNSQRSAFEQRLTIRVNQELKDQVNTLVESDDVPVPAKSEAGRLGLQLLCSAYSPVIDDCHEASDESFHVELPVPDGATVDGGPVSSLVVHSDRVVLTYTRDGREQRIIFDAELQDGDVIVTDCPPGFEIETQPSPAEHQHGEETEFQRLFEACNITLDLDR